MSMEGSTTNHMLSRGRASIAPSIYISFHIAVPLLRRAIAKHVAKFVSISKLLLGSLTLTHCCLKMPWLCAGDVIHSQSLTLTSDDLIWSSCGDYYDRTSIVMKIIQKASELWTAISGHESQHSHVNTWTWSQVITHCACSEHNARQQTTLDKWSADNITPIVLRFIHDIQKYIFPELASYFLPKN